MYAGRHEASSSKRRTEVISDVEERASSLAVGRAARRSRCPWARIGGVRGRVPQRLVEPCEPGDFRLFALGLFESGRVSVGGGDRGQVLGVHALSRGHRLSRPDDRVQRPAQLDPMPMSTAGRRRYNAAQQVCKKDLPSLGPHTSAEKATANAAALKYATCMRSNGVPDFPDPNGQGLIQIKRDRHPRAELAPVPEGPDGLQESGQRLR